MANVFGVGVPGVQVNIIPPQPILNGVPTDIIAAVGVGSWGPINSAVPVGSLPQGITNFGNPTVRKYDLMTQVYLSIQEGATNFRCVRVADGTQASASTILEDSAPSTGATLTALYTGIVGNTLNATITQGSGNTVANPTFKLTIFLTGGVPEVFDNIGGTGAQFWTNLVNAVNMGQNQLRGPSLLCIASTATGISSVTVSTAGSYATLPTIGTLGAGSGATLNATMKSVAASVVAAGTGYAPADTITATGGTHTISTIFNVVTTKLVTVAVNAGGTNYLVGDTITLAGGVFGTAAVLTVATLSGSAVATVTISNAGSYTTNSATFTQGATSGVGTGATFNTALFGINTLTVNTPGAYTALPSSPVSQGATSGSGTGATMTVLWGLLSVQVAAAGSGYTTSSTLSVTGGGGTGGATGLLVLGSQLTPTTNHATYTFSGGLDGATNVTSATLVGTDGVSRTGMYSLRNSGASIGYLCDADDPDQWTFQSAFGTSEKIYMIGTVAAGNEENPSYCVGLLASAGVTNYNFSLLTGDWLEFYDPFNGVHHLASGMGKKAGVLAVTTPSGSSLNKMIDGLFATQKSVNQTVYSEADLGILQTGGLDVITKGIPLGKELFGVALGINTSGNILTMFDNYPRMINFLSATMKTGMGLFIGLPQTPTTRAQAYSVLASFLQNLQDLGLIGNVNNPSAPAFSIVIDATNNPIEQVAKGYMQADVQVAFFSIIQNLIINLQAGGNVVINVLPPQVLTS